MIAYLLSAGIFLAFAVASWGLAYFTFVLCERAMAWNERRRTRAVRYRLLQRLERTRAR